MGNGLFSKIIKRGRSTLFRDVLSSENGEGLFCNDIAQKLGIINVTNNNPNRRLINILISSMKIKPTGELLGEFHHWSNGSGIGVHPFIKYKYSAKELPRIKDYIKKRKVYVGNGIYTIGSIKFRIIDDVFNLSI